MFNSKNDSNEAKYYKQVSKISDFLEFLKRVGKKTEAGNVTKNHGIA